MGAHHGEGQGDRGGVPQAGLKCRAPWPPLFPPRGPEATWVSPQLPSYLLTTFSVCYRIAVGIRFLMVKMMFIHHEG